ncbi:hypothetical protein [Methylocystis echinoides]|uniref:alpha/beta hydrolase n=1 Tax=Methylocystis echinoides TaxID=29468 RepID=UPI00341A487D
MTTSARTTFSPTEPQIEKVRRQALDAQSERIEIVGAEGSVRGRVHAAEGDSAILWAFGAGGGIGGPAGGVYGRLARRFQAPGIASLELDYRRPGDLRACVADALLGLSWLECAGKRRVALVGHSFGGAVVINAGVLSASAIGVAALSSQTAGTDVVGALSPKPLLLIHGGEDEILPDTCSRRIFARAREPKKLIIYPECRHGLDQCREELEQDLSLWLQSALIG